MGEQDRDGSLSDVPAGPLQVVGAVVVRVVDPDQMNSIVSPPQGGRFIKQHMDPQRLDAWDHAYRVMVS